MKFVVVTKWFAGLGFAARLHYRLDGVGTDYPSSPMRRQEALAATHYL